MINPNFEAEQAVIGDIFLDSELVMPKAAVLDPEEFSHPALSDIFRTCKRLYQERKPIDSVTVIGAMDDKYRNVILSACAAVPTIANYEAYIFAVRETSQRRKAYGKTEQFLEMLETREELSECRKAAADIANILSGNEPGQAVSASDGYLEFFSTREKPVKYIKTGFSHLDRKTYLDYGDYMVIGGRPSTGKTAFTLQTMLYMAREHNVAYFSLETSSRKIFDRLIASFTRTPFSQIKQGNIQDWNPIAQGYDDFKNLKFHVVDAAGWNVGRIQAKALELEAKIIFIDYLSLIQAEGRSKLEQVTNISIALHTMAQQNKITVIALSQLNRAGKAEPDMTSLRESGQIEQDADVILLLNMVNENDPCSDRDLIIAKNKEGSVGKLLLSFNGQYQRFEEIDTRYDMEMNS